MSFVIPTKEIIVNNDSQVVLREDDGTAYADGDCTPSAGGFMLEGFLGLVSGSALQLLAAATRIIKTAPSAGVTHKVAYTVTAASGGKKGDVFRLTFQGLDLTPTMFQDQTLEKQYQLGADRATAVLVIADIVAQINGDIYSPVIAYAGHNNAATPTQDDSAKIVLVAKDAGVEIGLYVGEYSVQDQTAYTIALAQVAVGTTVYHTVEDTNVVTANPANAINTYDYLKSIDWAKNLDFDRNVHWYPEKGASYNSYYFEVNGAVQSTVGSSPIPSQVNNAVRYGVKLWVKTGTTLATNMDLLTGDVNV